MDQMHVVETKDHAPIVEKEASGVMKPLFWVILALAIISLLIFLYRAFVNKPYQYGNNQSKALSPTINPDQNPTPVEQIQLKNGWKLYQINENATIQYPGNLSLVMDQSKAMITNNLKVNYTTAKPDVIQVNNFDLAIEIISSNISNIEKDTDITSQEVKLGNNTFQLIEMGAEDSGSRTYYVSLGHDKLLSFSYLFYSDADVNPEDTKKPGYLNNEAEKKIIEEILATLTIKSAQVSDGGCPKTEYVDCMPGPGPAKPECEPEYLKWATANCPGFKGAAY